VVNDLSLMLYSVIVLIWSRVNRITQRAALIIFILCMLISHMRAKSRVWDIFLSALTLLYFCRSICATWMTRLTWAKGFYNQPTHMALETVGETRGKMR